MAFGQQVRGLAGSRQSHRWQEMWCDPHQQPLVSPRTPGFRDWLVPGKAGSPISGSTEWAVCPSAETHSACCAACPDSSAEEGSMFTCTRTSGPAPTNQLRSSDATSKTKKARNFSELVTVIYGHSQQNQLSFLWLLRCSH